MKSCPAQPVQCDYVTIGCDFTGSKEDVKDHMTLDVERHLELAVTRLSAFDLEKAELRRDIYHNWVPTHPNSFDPTARQSQKQ